MEDEGDISSDSEDNEEEDTRNDEDDDANDDSDDENDNEDQTCLVIETYNFKTEIPYSLFASFIDTKLVQNTL